MTEFLWSILVSIVRAIDFALDIAVSISRMRQFARWVTGSDAIVEVAARKVLSPAAQRALAEAEQRRPFISFASGK